MFTDNILSFLSFLTIAMLMWLFVLLQITYQSFIGYKIDYTAKKIKTWVLNSENLGKS